MADFFYIAGGNVARQVSTLLAQIILARVLGSATFGELTYAFSIYLILAGLGDFGSRYYFWKRALAEEPSVRAQSVSKSFLTRMVFAAALLVPINLGISALSGGLLATLLHWYTLAILFNQVAFDWYFFSLEKTRSFFWFNVISGALYLGLTAALVRSPGQVTMVPILLAASYAVPGLALIWQAEIKTLAKLGATGIRQQVIGSALKLPLASYRYVPYDFLQRSYAGAVLVLAGIFFDKELLGHFRAAHLLYSFVSSLAIYLGTTYFNRVGREVGAEGDTRIIARVLTGLTLLVLPLALIGPEIAPSALSVVFGRDYQPASAVLSLLLMGLILPAAGNFIREAAIATKHSDVASYSLTATVAVTCGFLAFYHPPRLIALGYALLVGEAAGIVVLLFFLPIQLFSKKWLQIGATALASILVLKGSVHAVWLLARDRSALQLLAAEAVIVAAVYTAYVAILHKKFRVLVSA